MVVHLWSMRAGSAGQLSLACRAPKWRLCFISQPRSTSPGEQGVNIAVPVWATIRVTLPFHYPICSPPRGAGLTRLATDASLAGLRLIAKVTSGVRRQRKVLTHNSSQSEARDRLFGAAPAFVVTGEGRLNQTGRTELHSGRSFRQG